MWHHFVAAAAQTPHQKEGEKKEEEIFPSVVKNSRFVWEDKDKLGSGHFGQVFKAIDKEMDQMVAVKEIDTKGSSKILKMTRQETEILKRLDHPNIARLVASFKYEDTPGTLYIAMELCTGKELFDAIIDHGYLTEGITKQVIKQTLEAIEYCHNLPVDPVVHLDIKPENIILKEKWKGQGHPFPDVKLVDFGLATTVSSLNTCRPLGNCEKIGTPAYIAPEILTRKYNEKADIWSIGVVAYVLLTGTFPFEGATANANEINSLIFEDHVSSAARAFIKYLLTYNFEDRPSAAEALAAEWLAPATTSAALEPVPDNVIQRLKLLTQDNLQEKIATKNF